MNSKEIKEEKDGEFSYSPSLFFCRKMGTKCGKMGFSKYRISHIIGLIYTTGRIWKVLFVGDIYR